MIISHIEVEADCGEQFINCALQSIILAKQYNTIVFLNFNYCRVAVTFKDNKNSVWTKYQALINLGKPSVSL